MLKLKVRTPTDCLIVGLIVASFYAMGLLIIAMIFDRAMSPLLQVLSELCIMFLVANWLLFRLREELRAFMAHKRPEPLDLRVPVTRTDADGTVIDGTAAVTLTPHANALSLRLHDVRDLDGNEMELPAGSTLQGGFG